MILLNAGGIIGMIVMIYLIFHSPAFILLFIGLSRLKDKPESAKTLLILAGLYFLIGAGICGAILT